MLNGIKLVFGPDMFLHRGQRIVLESLREYKYSYFTETQKVSNHPNKNVTTEYNAPLI